MWTKILVTVAALSGSAELAVAQTNHFGHSGDMEHSAYGQDQATAGPVLSEPGQGAFAALSEIVRVLETDPQTDWSKVDLTGLRAHLVDMDRLISDAVVTQTNLPDGLTATATGDEDTIATLQRMVPAHTSQLIQDDRWTVIASVMDQGIELRVTSDDPAVAARIKGLGFFGLMASQDHHRTHHLMMALGENVEEH